MRTHQVTVAPTGDVFEVEEGDRILAAARRAGIWLPFECGWGSCGTCKATLVEGHVDLLFPASPSVSPRDSRRGRIVTCQTTPTSDVTIKPTWVATAPQPERPTTDYRAHLLAVEDLGPDLRRFTFDLDRQTCYSEGQYAILDFGDSLRRCYSMSSLAGTSTVEFIAKRYQTGEGSRRLFDLPVGSSISIECPYGDMWIRDNDRPVYLVAGGTGVSAILALARKLAYAVTPRQVRAFYGAGSVAELVCWDELRALMGSMPHGSLRGVVAKPDPNWHDSVGLVTDLLAEYPDGLPEADFYIAGPPSMVDAVLSQLKNSNIRLDRVHYDRFG